LKAKRLRGILRLAMEAEGTKEQVNPREFATCDVTWFY